MNNIEKTILEVNELMINIGEDETVSFKGYSVDICDLANIRDSLKKYIENGFLMTSKSNMNNVTKAVFGTIM